MKNTIRTLACAAVASLSLFSATQAFAADPAVGALLGAGTGAIVGNSVGGRDGAIVGSMIGAVTGAAIASDQPRRREHVEYLPPPPPARIYQPAPVYYAEPARVIAPVRVVSEPVYYVVPKHRHHRDYRYDDRYDDRYYRDAYR